MVPTGPFVEECRDSQLCHHLGHHQCRWSQALENPQTCSMEHRAQQSQGQRGSWRNGRGRRRDESSAVSMLPPRLVRSRLASERRREEEVLDTFSQHKAAAHLHAMACYVEILYGEIRAHEADTYNPTSATFRENPLPNPPPPTLTSTTLTSPLPLLIQQTTLLNWRPVK